MVHTRRPWKPWRVQPWLRSSRERLTLASGSEAQAGESSIDRKNLQALSVFGQVPPRGKQAHAENRHDSIRDVLRISEILYLLPAIQRSSKRMRPFSAFHWLLSAKRALQLLVV
jgi:hypothetical protein